MVRLLLVVAVSLAMLPVSAFAEGCPNIGGAAPEPAWNGNCVYRLVTPVTFVVPDGYVADLFDVRAQTIRHGMPAGTEWTANEFTLKPVSTLTGGTVQVVSAPAPSGVQVTPDGRQIVHRPEWDGCVTPGDRQHAAYLFEGDPNRAGRWIQPEPDRLPFSWVGEFSEAETWIWNPSFGFSDFADGSGPRIFAQESWVRVFNRVTVHLSC